MEKVDIVDQWAPPPPPKPPRRWPRRLGWIAGISFLLVVLLYFFATSFTCLQTFVLPQVNQAIHGKVKLSDASIRPFFGVRLWGVKVETAAFEEPLLTARELRVRYSLWDILHGTIHVKEVLIDSPVVQLIEYDDGTSNLERLLKSSKDEKRAEPPASPKESKPPRIHLETLTLTNAVLRRVKHYPNGTRDALELANVNLQVSRLGNGQMGNLKLGTDIRLEQAPAPDSPHTAGNSLQARLAGGFEFALTGELKPQSLAGSLALDVAKASQAFQTLSGVSAALDCSLTPTELKQLTLAFSQAGEALGQINVNGPLDLARQEGDLKIDISAIDRHALNLAGAPLGIDFGPTTINASQRLVLTQGGRFVSAIGKLSFNQLSVTQKGVSTQPLDVQLEYDVSLDQAENSARIQDFTLTGTQNQAPLVRGKLTRPMRLALGNATNLAEEAAFNLTVTNLNLQDWRAFLGNYAGTVGLRFNLLTKEAGKSLSFDLASDVIGLSAKLGSKALSQADAAIILRGQMDDFRKVQIDDCRVSLVHQRQPVLALDANGRYDVKEQGADVQAKAELSLPSLAGLLALPELKLSSGQVKLEARIAQQNLTPERTNSPSLSQTVSNRLRLEGLTGQYGKLRLDRFDAALNLVAALREQRAEIPKLTVALKQAGQNGGSLDLTGVYHLTNKTGRLTLAVTDLNHHALRFFVAEALGDTTLRNVAVNLTAEASYDAKAESGVKGRIQVVELLLTDPKGRLPMEPLSVEANLDGALRNEVADIREFVSAIRQGERSGGRLQVSGTYDLKQQIAKATLKLSDLNQTALRPFLASALGDKRLDSVSIGFDAAANYRPKEESSLTGELRVGNLVLTDPQKRWPSIPLDTDVKINAALRGDEATLRDLAVRLQLGDRPGGSLAANGRYDLAKKAGHVALKLTDLNQNALGPFLSSALGDKTLSSVSINTDIHAGYDADGKATLQGDIRVGKLSLQDPRNKVPTMPLSADLRLEGAFAKQVVTLDQCLVRLAPTARARNELAVTGRVHLARSNLIAGDLRLAADSLDLAPYYEMFAGQKSTNPPPHDASAQGKPADDRGVAPAPKPNMEPPAIPLPFQDFALSLNVGQLYLSELAVRDWQGTVKLNGGHVDAKPFQLLLNGAPVKAHAALDLGVPGYRYDVTFSADRVPAAPIVNTFAPDQRDKVKGDLFAELQIKGAGVTGTSLQTNLSGQIGFSFTNASLQLASPLIKNFFLPIGLLLGMPDLLKEPLRWVGASAQMGGGTIRVTQLNVGSPSFMADTQGEIPIAHVLTDSPLEKSPSRM